MLTHPSAALSVGGGVDGDSGILATGLQFISICTGNASMLAVSASLARCWLYTATLTQLLIYTEPSVLAALRALLTVPSFSA